MSFESTKIANSIKKLEQGFKKYDKNGSLKGTISVKDLGKIMI